MKYTPEDAAKIRQLQGKIRNISRKILREMQSRHVHYWLRISHLAQYADSLTIEINKIRLQDKYCRVIPF